MGHRFQTLFKQLVRGSRNDCLNSLFGAFKSRLAVFHGASRLVVGVLPTAPFPEGFAKQNWGAGRKHGFVQPRKK
jgi:hypothetical protein